MEPNLKPSKKDNFIKARLNKLSPFQQQLITDILRGILVIVSSIIYSLAVDIFLEPAELLSVGATSVGQIITATLQKMLPEGTHNFFTDNVGIYVFLINIPLFIIGFKHVSPRFVIFSGLSVLVQTIFMQEWVGGRDILASIGINPVEDKLFLAIIAGLFVGVAIGLALRYGTSTGGVDIIAQALSLKKGMSIGVISMIINISLAVVNGLIRGDIRLALYTFIFIIIMNICVDKIHTAYNCLRIDVITKHKEEVSKALLEGIQRGCTSIDVQGVYTKEMKFDIFMVVSSYEVDKAKKIIFEVDPDAFIMVSPIKRIIGAFFRHTIA